MAIVLLSEFLNIRCYYFFPQKVTKKRGCPTSLLGNLVFCGSCITIAILKLVADRESGVYSSVNEHFEVKPDAKRALLGNFLNVYC